MPEGTYVFTEKKIDYDKFYLIYCAYNSIDNRFSIEYLCAFFGVSKSGYYNWLNNFLHKSESQIKTQKEEEMIMEMFRLTIHKLGHVPGKRTFKSFLERDFNYQISVSTCARIMRKMHITATLPHKDAYKGQATYNHVCANHQNFVNRDFQIAPRTVILTDITYLYYGLKRQLCYLCTFKDAHTCEILGFAVSKTMDVSLIKTAYDNMMKVHKNEFKKDVNVYIHHDCGSQYLSTEFSEILKDNDFIQSVSRRGNSQDNAPMESFFGRLKIAVIDILIRCESYDLACQLITNYLHSYNYEQYQYNLGGLTPTEFYDYCVTGIYSLTYYYGIPACKLNSIKSIIDARERKAQEKREKIKKQLAIRKLEKGNYIDPISIVERDEKIIIKQLNALNEEKCVIEKEIGKYKTILDEIQKAKDFIDLADDKVIFNLTNPINWSYYKELNYVNSMNGLF